MAQRVKPTKKKNFMDFMDEQDTRIPAASNEPSAVTELNQYLDD